MPQIQTNSKNQEENIFKILNCNSQFKKNLQGKRMNNFILMLLKFSGIFGWRDAIMLFKKF
jgi:hypothetical protein